MIVVGLISGGKDSLHSLAIAVKKYNHKLCCVANLRPRADRPGANESDELDSYMYQTVGFNMVPSVAACLGVPLVVEDIKGKSVSLGMQYEQTEGDEVEDLYNLLRRVKEEFPCVEGVVTGAVLSTYQRMRVEDVCLRLGLASIAYLWQRDQSELLQDMIDTGMEAIVVKIASMGLKNYTFGKNNRAYAKIISRNSKQTLIFTQLVKAVSMRR